MAALFGFAGAPDRPLLARLGESLAHRGRGEARIVETCHASVAVRAVSDAPIALDTSGVASDADRHVVFAGCATGLGERDGPVTATTLLAEYESRGIDAIGDLRGAFVVVVVDGDTVHLARDGAGVRTVYYGRHDGRTFFAIEPKGVLAAPGFPRRIRPAAIAQYLSMSFVPGRRTMLEDLYELEAGHRLELRRDETRTVRWFEPEKIEPAGDDEPWVERFRALHRAAVATRLPAGEPVGVFLSGGLDSTVVAAEAAAQHDAPVISYAIHFGSDYPNELDFARAAAERAGTEHHELEVVPKQFLPRLRKILWHLDDPIGDPITVPNFELASRASRDVRWVLNGEGGDPLFGGPKNIPMMLHHWYGGIDRGPGFRERRYLESYRRSYDDWPRLVTPDVSRAVDSKNDLEGLFTPYFEADRPSAFLNKLCAINLRMKGAHLILPKVDRMAGAWGLTPASPLFDERLIRASFAMPPTLKLKGGIEKRVIKEAYAGEVPDSIIRRPKSGMRVPVRFWFQSEMKRYAKKILSPRELRRAGLFDERRVKQLLDYDVENGPGRFGLRLWMLVTFEIWRRIVVENEPV